MIRIGLVAAIAVLSAASANAQMQRVDPAMPSPLPESKVEPSGQLAETVPPRLIQNEQRSQSDADARHCLDLATNAQVHRCAHPYLSRTARAKVAKAARPAKPAAAAKAVESAKPAGLPKTPGSTVKPADAAKAADLVKPIDVTKPPRAPKTTETPAKKAEAAKGAPPAKAGPQDGKAAPPAKPTEDKKTK